MDLFWTICIGPKCNPKYPYKNEAERDFRQTEEKEAI